MKEQNKKVKPNFKNLGPRFGTQMKEIASIVGKLTPEQIQAIEFLEEILDDSEQVATYALDSGDMMFSNNRWLIHDRTLFEDFEDEKLKRLLLRTWIREIN